MKNLYELILISILLVLSLQDYHSKSKANKKSKKIPKAEFNNQTKKNIKRKLSGIPLNIYFDLYNFNYTFPNETLGENTKDIFIHAMNYAHEKLKKIISLDFETNYFEIDEENKALWNITYWNK